MATKKKSLLAAAGNAGGPLAIEDVFSTYLYTGNATARSITNGIDLAGEGGMVWIKTRNQADFHANWDTERGATNALSSNATNAEYSSSGITSFNADGFTLGSTYNASGDTFASWTFRKAPRFFDVVTYTGDGVAGRTVSHNLGVAPGCIIVKCTNLSRDWGVYHRGAAVIAEDVYLKLNLTNARSNSATYWNDTAPTDTEFTLGTALEVNQSGASYVAYLFAHDPLGESGDGSDGLIACGSYTGTGAAGNFVDLGWEPQWVLTKATNVTSEWNIWDSMRGVPTGAKDIYLRANSLNTEGDTAGSNRIDFNATGFTLQDSDVDTNGNNNGYIYIAIRRGPMRQPTSGTEVFEAAYENTTDDPRFDSPFPVDMAIQYYFPGSSFYPRVHSRLNQGKILTTSGTNAESSSTNAAFDYNEGFFLGIAAGTGFAHMFRRAPGFFDVVCYKGDSTTPRDISHNLGATPELVIVKARNSNDNWMAATTSLGNGYMKLNDVDKFDSTSTTRLLASSNTESTFRVGNDGSVNSSSYDYIAYLFSTLPGVSKVGSYTGNGSSQTIDCGFTSGARFVLIKRTDSSGDWYIWDTARGIVAANDPHLSLNTTAAEVTTDDSVDPDSSGFIVNQVAATNINVSSATYIFYAIA